MAIPPITPRSPSGSPSPVRAPGAGRNLNRSPSRGPSAVRPVAPGTVRPGTPTPPPHTPFQPGAGPSPPLNPIVAGLGGLIALAQFLWDLLNQKNPEPTAQIPIGERFDFGTVDGTIVVNGIYERDGFPYVDCASGTLSGLNADPLSIEWSTGGNGVGVSLNPASGATGSGTGGGGPGIQGTFTVHKADGSSITAPMGFAFALSPPGNGPFGLCGVGFAKNTVRGITFNGSPYSPPAGPREPLPEEIRPRVPTPLTAPEVAPDPVPQPEPLPLTVPQAPPGVAPVPVTPTTPRPGQAPAQAPARRPRTSPGPGTAPAVVPGQPAPLPVPAVGPAVIPLPPVVPVTPADVVVVGPDVIGGPAQAPPPTMQGIANELGRLEKKAELMLQRPTNSLSQNLLEEFLRTLLEDELRRAIRDIFDEVPGGSYSLVPACPPPGGGDPLPTVVVPFGVGDNPVDSLTGRIDALAELIQAHKNMGQPICKTPVVGEEVTVHFESET